MLKVIGGVPDGEYKAIASGTLPSGKPVVVNADGTVSAVAGSDAGLGSAQVLSASYLTAEIRVAYDANAGSYVIVYKDNGGDSGKGYVVAATLSGSTLTFGTPVKFIDSEVEAINIVYHEAAQKTVIVFSDDGAGKPGRGIVVTTTGTSVSLGAAGNMGTNVDSMTAVYDANAQKIVAAFRDRSNNTYGTAIVGTVSGTSISWGSKVVYNSAQSTRNVAVYDSSAQKVGIFYRDNGRNSGQGSGITGTVSGTSISFGGETGIGTSGNTVDELWAGYDPVSGKIAVVYSDSSNGSIITYSVAEISGTSMLVYSGGTDGSETAGGAGAGFPTVALSDGTLMFVYRQGVGSNGVFKFLTIDGSLNTISFSSPRETYKNEAIYSAGVAYDSTNEKVVIAYGLAAGREAIVYSAASTNLTAENYIGMSQGPVQVFAEGAGSLVEYHSTDTRGNNIAYDAASGKFVAIFNPGPPTSSPPSGYAIVGTVDPSDNSITYGTAVQFESGEVYGDYMGITYDSNAEKVVIAYMDTGDSNNSKAIVGTVSGTSISFGTPTTFNGQTQFLTSAFDSTNNKVVIAYKDASNSDYGTAIVGTVSGTSISFGSKVVFNSGNTNNIGICFDSTNDKIIIGYRDQALNQQATAIVGTVSGTSISFGSEVQVSPNSATDCVPIHDPVADKVVFVYSDSSDSNKGTVKIGTVSGTSISFGDAVIFDATSYDEGAGVFDANAGKVTIAYKGASGYPYIISGTVSGSTMTFGDPVQLGSFAAASYRFGCAYDSANFRIVSVFIDSDATPDTGESIVFSNFYEIRPSIADGGNASLDIIGSVSTNQSGLTAGEKYYVQTDGTLSTTAGSPSVLAGTAISATKLVVKT